ncbi:MAG: hypothetical protein KDD36_08855 [Flavobacteriales bacterium]|nr:hypothetical protein [Flavobacteriales bacterium]
MKQRIIFVQQMLNRKGKRVGVDGIAGSKTEAALNTVQGINKAWPVNRKCIAFIQLLAKENKIEPGPIDGLWGPQTEYAYNTVKALLEKGITVSSWRPDEVDIIKPNPNPNGWPMQDEASLRAYYGDVGTNQVKTELPYPMRLAWDKKTIVNRTSCHTKVSASLVRVLTKVKDHYGMAELKRLNLDVFGGCLNVRKKRGGTTYSTHSWGIALDFDPEHNKLDWGRDRALFAQPEYDAWWKYWEDEGWLSLGRSRNFDWMHVQAARL